MGKNYNTYLQLGIFAEKKINHLKTEKHIQFFGGIHNNFDTQELPWDLVK